MGTLVESEFGYDDGTLVQREGALREEAPEPIEHLLAIPCHGPVQEIPLHPERNHFPAAISLSDGLVSWDTGWGDEAFELVAEGSATAAELRHAGLYAYDLRSHLERRWRPPVTTLQVTVKQVDADFPSTIVEHVRGVFGSSTHTANDVLWLGDYRMTMRCGETCNAPEDEVGTIYEARL
jgi:hypothetical protein